jgi:hypothetical protein
LILRLAQARFGLLIRSKVAQADQPLVESELGGCTVVVVVGDGGDRVARFIFPRVRIGGGTHAHLGQKCTVGLVFFGRGDVLSGQCGQVVGLASFGMFKCARKNLCMGQAGQQCTQKRKA